jgi:antitoxin component YwqK of YwqJK toxin-antitoxin module
MGDAQADSRKADSTRILSLRLKPEIYEKLKSNIENSGLSASDFFKNGLADYETFANSESASDKRNTIYLVNQIMQKIYLVSGNADSSNKKNLQIQKQLETIVVLLIKVLKDAHSN